MLYSNIIYDNEVKFPSNYQFGLEACHFYYFYVINSVS